jgi:Bacterial SH3 domain
VNIGKDGVTANAGIPGTGLSYRQKVGGGGKAGWLAVLLVIGGLGVWAFQHMGKVEKAIAPARAPVSSTGPSTGLSTQASTATPATAAAPVGTGDNMQRFVHRQGAILRAKPETSGDILKRELKGAAVALVSESDGWAKVRDGDVTGYMRSSLLGAEPPR